MNGNDVFGGGGQAAPTRVPIHPTRRLERGMLETERPPAEAALAANDASTGQRRQSVVRVTAHLNCLLCGRERGTLEAAAWPPSGGGQAATGAWPPARARRSRPVVLRQCGGRVIATDVTSRRVWLDVPVDWQAAERPRRGRPPKRLAERGAESAA